MHRLVVDTRLNIKCGLVSTGEDVEEEIFKLSHTCCDSLDGRDLRDAELCKGMTGDNSRDSYG
jgi:hypothetical protein